MKRLILTGIAILFAMSQQVMAQKLTEKSSVSSEDSMKVVVDSLRQVVSQLSTTVKGNSDEMLNKKIWKDRAKYFNISYVNQSLTLKDEDVTWRNKMGVAITAGRTYYLHKKPLFGMIKFGIDWSYLDINFSNYEDKFNYFYNEDADYNNDYDYDYGYDEEEEGPVNMYQIEVGMQIGPSITINPINHLKISGYFRFAPSASILYLDDSVGANYASFFVLGGAISYKVISLGIEGRWGTTKYTFDEDDYEEDYSMEHETQANTIPEPKWKTGSTRIYVSFRF